MLNCGCQVSTFIKHHNSNYAVKKKNNSTQNINQQKLASICIDS